MSDDTTALGGRLSERGAVLDEFEARWRGFVRSWRRAASEGPDAVAALVAEALDAGIGSGDPPRGVAAQPPAARVNAARAVVAASGYLDADDYVVRHRLRRDTDPYRHHVEEGWRLLQNPSTRFDLWSYWVDHLDPTRDGVDPLLHWLLLGRHRGLGPVPEPAPSRTPTRMDPGTAPRRVCLFAAHDRDGIVDDYVVTYLRELSRHADVHYLADGVLEPGELAKLEEVTVGAWSVPHGGYDFGSFSALAGDLVGWDVIDTYDELLLANDSCFLLRPLDETFARMDARACDWWSLQATSMEHDEHYFRDDSPIPLAEAKRTLVGPRQINDVRYLHLSSYFLAFRRPVFTDPGFRWRLDTVVPQEAKALVVHKYEVGISRYLTDAGFDFDTWLPDLQPFHPLYSRHVFDLVGQGFPLAKRNFLGENPRRAPGVGQWRERLRELAPDARIEEMEANLVRVTDPARVHDAYDVVQDPATARRTVRTYPLAGHPFRRMDRETPSFSHWWAFVASPSGRMDPGVRAVFEVVRHDPSLHKVVLTRTRALEEDLSGAEVHVVPASTFEGQEALVRCAVVVVADPLGLALPLTPLPARHRVVHVGARWSPAALSTSLDVDAVAAASPLEVLARRVADPGLAPADVWLTGLPRHDLLVPGAVLPADLARAEERLVAHLGGRPLVIVEGSGAAPFDDADVGRLAQWADTSGVVMGVRESRPDAPDGLTRTLAALEPLGLSDRSGVPEAVAWRTAAVVVADSAAGECDARAAGHALLVHGPGDDLGELLADLDALVRSDRPGSMDTAPEPDAAPIDGGAARRFAARVREREVERAEVRTGR